MLESYSGSRVKRETRHPVYPDTLHDDLFYKFFQLDVLKIIFPGGLGILF